MVRGLVLLSYAALLVALPLAVVWWQGGPVADYLRLPPITHPRPPAGFAWPALGVMALVTGLAVFPLLHRVAKSHCPRWQPVHRRLPLWGWIGALLLAGAWIVAWNRFPWMGALQRHTFTPLWLGYIVVIQAVSWRRSGHCLLCDRPGPFLILFPASAAFWWSYEYLNRYVENWYYLGAGELGAGEYLLFASLPFSTVLPAVLGTAQWLQTHPGVDCGLGRLRPAPWLTRPALFGALVIVGALGLVAIAGWPHYAYPLVWIAPLCLLLGIQGVAGQPPPLLCEVARGDWRRVWRFAIAGLICGFFWELWNAGSLAHWEYSIPGVQGWQLFEMPLIGYAGYLPFGVTCAAVVDLILPPSARAAPTAPTP